jgi:hypothetical protein
MYIHNYGSLFIQWDNVKNAKNIEKHGVAFDEAATVLFDENALEFYDKDHSSLEDRFWILGNSHRGRVLLVVYSFRRLSHGKESYYRIISARTASKKERKIYESEGQGL